MQEKAKKGGGRGSGSAQRGGRGASKSKGKAGNRSSGASDVSHAKDDLHAGMKKKNAGKLAGEIATNCSACWSEHA